ncbi:MAG: DUF7594 domain-containing protein [Actinomycetota bacterium]
MSLADAIIQEASPGTNFGSRTTLLADNSPAIRFLMRLDVSVPEGKVPKRVTLSLYCVEASPAAGTVRLVTGPWSEGSVTWDNAPAFGSQVLATLGAVAEGSRHQVDLTAAAAGRTTLDVMVVGGSNNGADFSSREASSARRPTLVVVYGDAGGQDPEPDPEPGHEFHIGLIGDTPYSSSEAEDLLDLRATMNGAGLAYTVHVGDIKSGSSPCTDTAYTSAKAIFDGFGMFVYTPGDNEWSDCSDREERLGYLRQVFFPGDETLGQKRETVARQAGYPENARWTRGGILFVTVHTVGSSNNRSGSEYPGRNAANVSWLRAAFDAALAQGSRGVVVITHANWGDPYHSTSRSGFDDMKEVLEEEVVAFGKPVAFVHGDTHKFRVDQPLAAGNLTRIEVHAGADDWVRLRVVADSRVFVVTSHSR